jgi:hypothetical protein
MNPFGWNSLVLVLLLASLQAPGRPAGAASLDRELLKQAPVILRYAREHGYRNLGVLKFRVKKGDEPVSDNVGTLNLNLASRLEIALVLADDFSNPIGIVRDASAVAAKIPGANHLKADGRRALFGGRYPLAWGEEQVIPDAFLTGVVSVSTDLRELSVGIVVFDKRGETLDKVVQFTATPDPPVLAEAGESYVLTRGLFDKGQVELTSTVVDLAAQVKSAQQPNPLQDPSAPVALEILYDGRPVLLEIRGGKALVREPDEGQKVALVLRRTDGSPDRYAAVLSVNGENTLFKERCSPLDAQKWVLNPGDPPIAVRGFQTDEGTAESFRVLSRGESARNVMNYSSDVGTIGLVVFRERKIRGEPVADIDEDEDLAALSRGTFPKKAPKNFAALRQQLRPASSDPSRGLIASGEKNAAAIRRVEFSPDPTPVMSATITYYRP